jgi:hypothetical protein
MEVYSVINISYRKVGGLRFLKIGRLTLMFCVSKEYRPLKKTLSHADLSAAELAH